VIAIHVIIAVVIAVVIAIIGAVVVVVVIGQEVDVSEGGATAKLPKPQRQLANGYYYIQN